MNRQRHLYFQQTDQFSVVLENLIKIHSYICTI